MNKYVLTATSKSQAHARNLRKNMTKEEKHLWYDFLSLQKIRFRKQRAIGKYIADFYCPQAKLIIELDGSQHFEEAAEKYDEERTAFFDSLGIRVLRFTNREVNLEFEDVCNTILAELGLEF